MRYETLLANLFKDEEFNQSKYDILNPLYENAMIVQHDFNSELASTVYNDTPFSVSLNTSPLKNPKRTLEKLHNDKNSDLDKVYDIVRAKVIGHNVPEFYAITSVFRQSDTFSIFEERDTYYPDIPQIDFKEKPNSRFYRDMKVILQHNVTGLKCELLFELYFFDEIYKDTHILYEENRSLIPGVSIMGDNSQKKLDYLKVILDNRINIIKINETQVLKYNQRHPSDLQLVPGYDLVQRYANSQVAYQKSHHPDLRALSDIISKKIPFNKRYKKERDLLYNQTEKLLEYLQKQR